MRPDLKIFYTQSSQKLTEALCDTLGVSAGSQLRKNFADGEVSVTVEDNVQHQNVIVVAATNPPAENWIEALFLLDTLRQMNPGKLTLVLPYTGYNRQDELLEHQSQSARIHLQTLCRYPDEIITVDVHTKTTLQHCNQLPHVHISSLEIFADRLRPELAKLDYVFAAPDSGSMLRARSFAEHFNQTELLTFKKTRSSHNTVENVTLNQETDLQNKTVLLIDDIVDTGGTLIASAAEAKDAGAHEVWAVVTHGLLSKDAVSKLDQSSIKRLFVSDSIDSVAAKAAEFENTEVTITSIVPQLAETVQKL